ncbi:protein phosphatase PPM5, putative [Plasmodium gallinaceum]|uniref:Protein phosphatase PPM5, putative n=1 Tax=Plasmodium gallinaceum TaxID=5849 RepID=A0A1J1GYN1_PLAGA|nr:protein phosphatase PPM5, putative [Plasmodium gallinaceum]CRG97682.1 protein phosphatase PPM5, putative [Plasmodium gallinaceum]
MGTCTSSIKKQTALKGDKNTRRRLSISTKSELPNDTEEIKRSIQELKENEDRFKESSENVIIERESTIKEKEKKVDKQKRNIKKRSSVAGVRASHFQEDFEKKCVKIKGSVDRLNQNGIGYVCRKGLKPESPNQDDFIIITMENLALYAIFDGHGPYGHDVSNYVQKELPYMIIKNENFLKNPKEVFTEAFLNIHESIEKTTNAYLESFANQNNNNPLGSDIYLNKHNDSSDEEDENDETDSDSYDNEDSDNCFEKKKSDETCKNDNEKENLIQKKEEKTLKKKKKKKKKIFFDSTMSGTTATIIVHLFKEKKLYIAYVGDSRAVLGKKKDGSNHLVAVELTKDHKPNSSGEKKRILNSGGQVIKLEGDIPYRVFIKNKFYPGLAMSRAIGDTIGHQIGIISEPDFIEVNINEEEDILVLICSDGVWEFISSEEAINLIYEFGYENVQDAVENLAKESWNRWLNEEENIVDDITIQAIYLSEKSKNQQKKNIT